MHVGKIAPYALDARTWMGPWDYPNWMRDEYFCQNHIFLTWFGPDSGNVVPLLVPQFKIDRRKDLEATTDQYCVAKDVGTLLGAPVALGFVAEIQPDRKTVWVSDQVWVNGVPQMDVALTQQPLLSWLAWTTDLGSRALAGGGTLGCFQREYQRVPW